MRGEGLEWCFEAEAFPRRCVEVPDDTVDVLVGAAGETGFTRQVASQATVGVFDAATLPRAMRIAKEGADPDGVRNAFVASELATIVVGDCLHRC